MTENEIAMIIEDQSVEIHKTPGPGLLGSVYKAALAHGLKRLGIDSYWLFCER